MEVQETQIRSPRIVIMESCLSIFGVNTLLMSMTSGFCSMIGAEVFSASSRGISVSHKKLRSVNLVVGAEKLDIMQKTQYKAKAR